MSLPARLRAFGISKALDYLERDPDANLPKLMDWLDKYTGERLASCYAVCPVAPKCGNTQQFLPVSLPRYSA